MEQCLVGMLSTRQVEQCLVGAKSIGLTTRPTERKVGLVVKPLDFAYKFSNRRFETDLDQTTMISFGPYYIVFMWVVVGTRVDYPSGQLWSIIVLEWNQ